MIQISSRDNSVKLDVPFNAWKIQGDTHNEIVEFELESGQMIDFHPNPLDVIFFIVSGTGRISLENGSYDVRKGDCAPVPGGIDRKWENTGSDTLHVLVIKQVK